MHDDNRFGAPHQLCTCPQLTWTTGPSAADVRRCREASNGLTHPVLTAEDLKQLLEAR